MSIYLLQGLVLGFAAAVQPGPLMAFMVTQTLAHGFRKTWMMAFAPLISDGPIIALALLVLVQMPAWLQRGLNAASGIFILYLAWSAFRQWRHFISPEQVAAPTGQQGIVKAALMNALNPMPYIYWSLVTGPILMAGWRESPALGLTFILSFYFVFIGGRFAILAVFSAARGLGSRVSRAMLGISVLTLAGFGVLQLSRALMG